MGAPIPSDARLKGPFTPMRFEATVEDCVVSDGEIPKDLCGGFYRCGPTWKRPTKQGTNGLLSMDGMVQALTFENGRADFRNRWIRTPKYMLEDRHGRGMFEWSDGDFGDWRTWGYGDVRRDEHTIGIPQGTNNINVFPFQGDVITAGEQGGPPIALDPMTLETKGPVPWSPKISRGLVEPAAYGDCSFTAHPKWDYETGELYGWAYRDEEPYVTLHRIEPDGAVTTLPLWDAPYPTVAHDIWLTDEWIVLPFQPFIADRERITRDDTSIFAWKPESLPTVIALVPRTLTGDVRWIEAEIEPQYVMHTLSANVEGNRLILDAPIFDRPPFPFEQDFKPGDDVALFYSLAKSSFGRWTIDLDTEKVTAETISDRPAELPKVDERHYGKGYEWGYMVGGEAKRKGMSMKSLLAYNVKKGTEAVYTIRDDQPVAVLEPTFVARKPDAPEGDGWILVPVSKWRDNLGEYLIFDTDDITQGPVCRIEIPFRLGWTPHGHFMDFRDKPRNGIGASATG